MLYVFGDIHGADYAYFKLKSHLGITNNDDVFILGDVVDGNSKDPAACLRILDDTIKYDNIHLMLGNHELVYALINDEPEEEREKSIYLEMINSPTFGGKEFWKYLNNNCSQKERDLYISYMGSLPDYSVINANGTLFYLTHAEPLDEDWYSCFWEELCLDYDYEAEIFGSELAQRELASDPSIKRAISITGHIPTKYYFNERPDLVESKYKEKAGDKVKTQIPLFYNNHIIMDCGCRGNSLGKSYDGWRSDLAVLGIDTSGERNKFFIYSYNDIT